MKGTKNLLLLIVLLGAQAAFGQSVSSVYSNRGIGLMNYEGLPNNFGMGEVGIATPSSWLLNYQNPAFLPFNRVSVFQVGIEMDRRSISSSSVDGKKVTGGLRYLNYAFPVINGKWTTSFGLSPFSTVNTNTFTVSEIDGAPNNAIARTTYVGSGGLSQFHWSNGFLLGKGFYLGVRSSMLFGTVEDVETTIIEEEGVSSFEVTVTDVSSYSGLRNEIGLGYRKKVSDENRYLNFGIVYKFSKDLKGSRDQSIQNIGNERPVIENERFTYGLPSSIGFGTSYEIGREFLFGADLTLTQWENSGLGDIPLVNTSQVAVGAEWTPEYNDVNQYWRRITYRFGLNLGQLPYEVSGQAIREVGINFGATLPVRLSSLDLGLKYGRLGTLENDLVRESYFRIVFGATINDRWFVKRRYD